MASKIYKLHNLKYISPLPIKTSNHWQPKPEFAPCALSRHCPYILKLLSMQLWMLLFFKVILRKPHPISVKQANVRNMNFPVCIPVHIISFTLYYHVPLGNTLKYYVSF